MAKGPSITDGVAAIIARVYREHPKWKAPEIRSEASYLLCAKNPELPSGWPSLSAVQKVLAIVRKKEKELPHDPQEKPWSTAMLDDYPISPEATASVLKVWKFRIEKENTFTIREAKWAARLSGLLEDIEKLSWRASQYARTELMFQLIGRPFDSIVLDKLLMGLPAGIGTFMEFLALLAEQKEDLESGIKDGVEQIRELIQAKQIKRKGGKP